MLRLTLLTNPASTGYTLRIMNASTSARQAGANPVSDDRLKTHALDDHLFCFWERFTWFGFYSPVQLCNGTYDDPVAEAVTLAEALDTIESIGIYLALPRFNRRYETGFTGVSWYYQAAEYEQLKNAKRNAGAGA